MAKIGSNWVAKHDWSPLRHPMVFTSAKKLHLKNQSNKRWHHSNSWCRHYSREAQICAVSGVIPTHIVTRRGSSSLTMHRSWTQKSHNFWLATLRRLNWLMDLWWTCVYTRTVDIKQSTTPFLHILSCQQLANTTGRCATINHNNGSTLAHFY